MSFTIEPSPYMVDEEYRNFVIMNHSNHSYATNNKITKIFTKDSWKDLPCFIIGGGSSLKDFDFTWLRGHRTIGINKAFLRFTPSINYAMDSNFYRGIYDGTYDKQEGCRVLTKWLEYSGHRVFLTPMEFNKYGEEVYLVRRKWKIEVNQKDLDEGIYGGQNSAAGAINLAISLGASPIYLLGYDMKCGVKTHYHTGYPDRDPVLFNTKLQEYKAEIEELSKLWKEYNISIINLGPDSDLTCFPFMDFHTVLGVNSANL